VPNLPADAKFLQERGNNTVYLTASGAKHG
jgi:hypothetical protein